MGSIRSRIASASIWLASAKLITNALSTISIFFLARILDPSDFGIVALATSITAVIGSATELSLSQALINIKEPTAQHYQTAWTLSLLRALLIALVVCVCSSLIAVSSGEPRIEYVLYALAGTIVITGLKNPGLAMLERRLVFKQALLLAISTNLIAFIVSIVLALTTHSYWALVGGTAAGQIASVIFSYLIIPFKPKFHLSKSSELWRFSVWLTLSELVTTLNYRFDQILVGYFLGRGELGFYTVGGRVAQLPGREAVRPVTATLFPAFSLVQDDPARLRAAYARVQTLVTYVALPISALVALVADLLVPLVMGDKWVPAVIVVQVVAAATALETLGSLADPLAMSRGQTRTIFGRNCLKLAVRLPLIVAGAFVGGLNGLLSLRALAGLIGVFIDMSLVNTLIGIGIFEQLRQNFRSFAALIAMAGANVALRLFLPNGSKPTEILFQILLLCTASCAVYVVTTFLIWWMTGRREGPEYELFHIALSLRSRLKQKLKQPGSTS